MVNYITIHDISVLSTLIPVFTGVFKWRKLDTALRIICILAIISFFFDAIMIIIKTNQGNNLVYGHVYLVIQTALLCLFFIKIPGLEKRYKRWVLVFSVFSIFFSFFLGAVYHIDVKINQPLLVYSSIVAILLSFLYFYDLLLHGFHIPLWNLSTFYLVSGLLIYHVSSTAIFITFDYFELEVAEKLWQFQSAGYILYNLLVAFGFYIHKKVNSDE